MRVFAELSREDVAVRAHLGACGQCRDDVEELRGVLRSIGASDLREPPASVLARALEIVASHGRADEAPVPARSSRRRATMRR